MRATIVPTPSRASALNGLVLGLLVLLGGAPGAQAGPGPQLEVSVTSVVFPGQVMVGMGTSENHFRLTNVGSGTLRLRRWRVGGPAPLDFQIGGCSLVQGVTTNLQPGQWCDVYVSFQPTAPGLRTATISLESNDPAHPWVEIPLSGNAVGGAPDIRVTPAALSFGVAALNVWSAPRTITVQSTGPAPLTITGVSVDDARFSFTHNCGVLAAVNSGLSPLECTVEVRFRPTLAGPVPGRLSIFSNDPQGPVEVPLAGVGGGPVVGVVPVFQIGTVFMGLSATRELVIQNLAPAGTGHLHVSATFLGGVHGTDFGVSPVGACADVAEGASCTLAVTFRPRSMGVRTAVLGISSDAGGVPGALSSVTLVGTGYFSPTTYPPLLPPSSDRDFRGVGSPTSCGGANTEFTLPVPVTRAFGSRNPLPVGATGQPSLGAALASGALAPTATLELMMLQEGPPGRHSVMIGGVLAGVFTPQPTGVWSLVTVTFPSTSVLFPPVAPFGSAPTPAINTLTFRPDADAVGSCLSVAWARLRVKMASPVIFVHGNGSDGAFFVRRGAAGRLNAAGIPNDTSIDLPVASVSANAAALQAVLPRVVRSFGVDGVHLVTHSKGGLDARLWLSANAAFNTGGSSGFRVLSVTTLATPHRGSPLADLQMAIAGSVISFGGVPLPTLPALGIPVASAATPDLTTWANLSFDPPLPSGVDYRMLASDVDADGDSFIVSAPVDEYAPLRAEAGLPAGFGTDVLATTVHAFLSTTQSVITVPLPAPVPVSLPIVGPVLALWRLPVAIPGLGSPNDLLVRADSALGAPPPFVPAFGSAAASTLVGDHAAMGGPGAGVALVPLLLATDTVRGDLR